MKSVSDISFEGKKALIRVDFNVPISDGVVTDNTRIKRSLPTIEKILEDGGAVVLMSHLGRPKGFDEQYSLKQIIPSLEDLFNLKVNFSENCVGEEAILAFNNLEMGEILLLENLRFHPEEKMGNQDFSKELSKLGDIYVNDAFGTAHRKHASTAVIADFFDNESKCFGLLMKEELDALKKVVQSPESPTVGIIGGAKVSSKISVLENLLPVLDKIIIGGGMAYTFILAMGGKVGDSLKEEDMIKTAKTIINKAEENNCKLIFPVDVLAADSFSKDADTQNFDVNSIPEGWMGLDAGPKSIELFNDTLSGAKTILWNGPVGVFEWEKFEIGTKTIALKVVEETKNGAFSLVGGGDSVAAINQYGLASKVSYISTGGGALLEFLEGKLLPGIEALS